MVKQRALVSVLKSTRWLLDILVTGLYRTGLPDGIHICIPKIPNWVFIEDFVMENVSMYIL
jgi:hypothetical protein